MLKDLKIHTKHDILKISKGNEENKSNHRHPHVSIIHKAKIDSKAAPIAQNDSINTTHLARCALGKNSAYKVTLKYPNFFNKLNF